MRGCWVGCIHLKLAQTQLLDNALTPDADDAVVAAIADDVVAAVAPANAQDTQMRTMS